MTGASAVWSVGYLLLALHRAYGEAWITALVKGAVVFFIYMAASLLFASAALMLAISRTQTGS